MIRRRRPSDNAGSRAHECADVAQRAADAASFGAVVRCWLKDVAAARRERADRPARPLVARSGWGAAHLWPDRPSLAPPAPCRASHAASSRCSGRRVHFVDAWRSRNPTSRGERSTPTMIGPLISRPPPYSRRPSVGGLSPVRQCDVLPSWLDEAPDWRRGSPGPRCRSPARRPQPARHRCRQRLLGATGRRCAPTSVLPMTNP